MIRLALNAITSFSTLPLRVASHLNVMMGLVGFATPAWIANAVRYAVGLCLSFTLNRRWTFGVRGNIAAQEVARFLGVFTLSYAVNLGTLALMRSIGFTDSLIGQAPAMVAYSASFFLLSRRFVFHSRISTQ